MPCLSQEAVARVPVRSARGQSKRVLGCCLVGRGIKDSFQGCGELWVFPVCLAVTNCTGVPASGPHTQKEIWCPLSALWGPQALGLQHPQLGSPNLLQPLRGAGRCQRGLEGCGDRPGGQGSATQHSVCQQCPRRARRWWAAGRGGGWGTGAWSPPQSSWPTSSCWAWS